MRSLISLPVFVLFLSSLGAQSIKWEKNLGGSDWERAHSIIQTTDGGFAVAGRAESSDGDIGGNNNGAYDHWVVKLDGNGNLQWENNLGGSEADEAHDLVQTADGGFVVAGFSGSSDGDVGGNKGDDDCWVVKLDDTGAIQWEKNLGGSYDDRAYSIVQTADGGFAMAGSSVSSDGDVGGNNGGDDFWVVKLNDTGAIQWEKNFGGSKSDVAYSLTQTTDGGFAVAGRSRSSDGDVGGNKGRTDYWIVKLDGNGNLQWENNIGGSEGDDARSIVQTDDGGFVLAGGSNSSDGDVGGSNGGFEYWVVKLDDNGAIQWENNLGGGQWDIAYSIVQTDDGGFAVAGNSPSSDGDVGDNNGSEDYWVVKLDGNGSLQWERNLGGSSADKARSVVQTSGGGFAVAGKSRSSDGDVGGNEGVEDFWIVKLGDQGTGISDRPQKNAFDLHPNPTRGKIRIDLDRSHEKVRVTIRDVMGRTVRSQILENVSNFKTAIEGEAGVYFVELTPEEGTRKTIRVVKQ